MSIASDIKLQELEERIAKLEEQLSSSQDETLQKLWGEIKTIKMRMAKKNDRE